MKAVRIERYGNENVVEIAEVDQPTAGTVEAVGDNVKDFAPGDDVYGYLSAYSSGYADYVAAPASEFARKPKQIDFDTAASVPVGALTARQGIFDHGNWRPGNAS
jgi:NADPH:quinone reductase-like Zn-dependent oxidoreductase